MRPRSCAGDLRRSATSCCPAARNRFIQAGAIIALRHHERYDGSGYPDGLVGDEIPLEARIVAVADVFDALISPRPYKKAWEKDAARLTCTQRGRLFDPACVDALIRGRTRLDDICERYSTVQSRPGWSEPCPTSSWVRSRLKAHRGDSEHGQALIRVALISIILTYALLPSSRQVAPLLLMNTPSS